MDDPNFNTYLKNKNMFKCAKLASNFILLEFFLYEEVSSESLDIPYNRCQFILLTERKGKICGLVGKSQGMNFSHRYFEFENLVQTVFSMCLSRNHTRKKAILLHFIFLLYICWFVSDLPQLKWIFWYDDNFYICIF